MMPHKAFFEIDMLTMVQINNVYPEWDHTGWNLERGQVGLCDSKNKYC